MRLRPRDPDFGLLFAATALGQLGDRVLFLALPLVAVVALHADPFQVGLLTTLTTAGSLLVGLPAGAWVDRTRKRPVLVVADLARALVLMTVPTAWWTGLLSVRWLYGVALVHGVLTVFFDVAYVGLLPHLVGRGRLVEANARLSAVRSVTSIGGPAVAGPLAGWAGAPAAVVASAAGMAVSGLLASRIRERETEPGARGRSGTRRRPRLRREIKEGLKFVLGHPVLRATVVGDAVFNLFLVMYQTMLLVFLEREVGLGPSAVGLVLSGMGCGALLGALLATRVSRRLGQGPVIWLAPLVTCPLTALMPAARPGWSVCVAAAGLAALSLGGVVRVVAQSSVQQALTPDRLLGRMGATARFVSWGGLPLGGVLGGASGSAFGAAPTLWLGAAGMTLSFLPVFLSPLRTLRTPRPSPLPAGQPSAPSARSAPSATGGRPVGPPPARAHGSPASGTIRVYSALFSMPSERSRPVEERGPMVRAMAGAAGTAGTAAGHDRRGTPLVTGCGRRIDVRCLWLGRPERPVGRITLDVGEDQGGEPGVWAALTPDEARDLARLLLQQAGAAERPAADRP